MKTKPCVKYRVFEITNDGLIKHGQHDYHSKGFFNVNYDSMELAAEAVHKEDGQYSGYIILPVANWEDIE